MASNKPAFVVYAVKDRGEGKKSSWREIGAAWPHKEGGGFSVELDALPVHGRIVLMPPKPESDTPAA
jgi:hypothetical protein